jgi:hypothetical protein
MFCVSIDRERANQDKSSWGYEATTNIISFLGFLCNTIDIINFLYRYSCVYNWNWKSYRWCIKIIFKYVATTSAPSSILSSLTVNWIECNANEQFLFHVHAHLNIFVNGQLMYIPSQIGIFLRNAFTGYIHTMKPASYISNHR